MNAIKLCFILGYYFICEKSSVKIILLVYV